MTKLVIEHNLHSKTPRTRWRVTVWYGTLSWCRTYAPTVPAALRLVKQWAKEDAIYNQGGAE